MKAAILHQYGEVPKYGNFPLPAVQHDNQALLHVRAAAIKSLDKSKASGAHYAGGGRLVHPQVVGGDGVGILPDGTRVYAFGLTGMMAEQALADKSRLVKLPPHLDELTAAALPNAILGSAAALRFRARVQPGDTVLINGATGVTGQLAVQLARYYGAGKVIATGRNASVLQKLHDQGVETVSLEQPDELLLIQLRAIHAHTPINVVIDYLWGRPAEVLLTALRGRGEATHHVRFVTVGSMAGEHLTLSAGILRSANVTLLGSGLGSIAEADMRRMFSEELPALLQLAADKQLAISTVAVPLIDIEAAWNRDLGNGQRLVVTI